MKHGNILVHEAQVFAIKKRQKLIKECKLSGIKYNCRVNDKDGLFLNGLVLGWDEDGKVLVQDTFMYNGEKATHIYHLPYTDLEKAA